MCEWKNIAGYEGLYQISNTGLVKSICGEEHILKSSASSSGYQMVVLCKNKKKSSKTVHRLVAEAFIPNLHHYPCINHKDENKGNNVVSNLEWVTYTDNLTYGVHQKRLEKLRKRVGQYEIDGRKVAEYPSECDASIAVSGKRTNASSISRAIKGERKTYKGYVWKEEQ